MIDSDVADTTVYALWYITMCAGHVSQLLIILLWFINLFVKNASTPLQLLQWFHGYELMWIHLAPPSRCVKWHHLTAPFSARFLIAAAPCPYDLATVDWRDFFRWYQCPVVPSDHCRT